MRLKSITFFGVFILLFASVNAASEKNNKESPSNSAQELRRKVNEQVQHALDKEKKEAKRREKYPEAVGSKDLPIINRMAVLESMFQKLDFETAKNVFLAELRSGNKEEGTVVIPRPNLSESESRHLLSQMTFGPYKGQPSWARRLAAFLTAYELAFTGTAERGLGLDPQTQKKDALNLAFLVSQDGKPTFLLPFMRAFNYAHFGQEAGGMHLDTQRSVSFAIAVAKMEEPYSTLAQHRDIYQVEKNKLHGFLSRRKDDSPDALRELDRIKTLADQSVGLVYKDVSVTIAEKE